MNQGGGSAPATTGPAGVLRAIWALSSFRWALALGTLAGAVLSFVPLLAVHGVESAVALGVLVPPLCAWVAARLSIAARAATQPVSGLGLAGRSMLAGLLVLLAPVLVLALSALRVRNCAPLEGLLFIALGPGAGVVLASLAGACAGALSVRPTRATALAAAAPLAGVGLGLLGFYATPGVFAYGHFFGYFPGALYDEYAPLPTPLLTLRLVTFAWCGALVCALAGHFDPARKRLALAPQPGRAALSFVLVVALAVGLLGAAQGEALGHRTSVEHMQAALGARVLSERCELIIPREMPPARRARTLDDCDYRVRQMEHWFGLRQPGRVRVFVFRSAEEKRALMGAAHTNIAKPWRREIYLQDGGWPHPVLAHEMAHIVAGNAGRGPLRIAGPLFGLYPDFALIEGVAVAAAWVNSSPSGLTPHQWTRAMLEQGLAPPLQDLFGTGFLQQQRRVAYTLAGSALRYVADTYGASAVRRIYAGSDVRAVLGISIAELERDFHAFLRTVPLPESARALAQQRFTGSSVLSSICPHVKAELARELDGHLSAGDGEQAARTCRALLEIDPADTGVRATLAAVLARTGQLDAAHSELGALQGPEPAAPTVIASARQLLADEALRGGRHAEALAIYRELLAQPNDRDTLRMLQVKSLALTGSARERDLVFALLVGEQAPADGATAVYLTRELREVRKDGLPHYLEARQLLMRERYAEAAALLAQARKLGLPTAEIALEALRVEAICRHGAGELQHAATLWRELKAKAPDPALHAEADEWLARARHATRAIVKR